MGQDREASDGPPLGLENTDNVVPRWKINGARHSDPGVGRDYRDLGPFPHTLHRAALVGPYASGGGCSVRRGSPPGCQERGASVQGAGSQAARAGGGPPIAVGRVGGRPGGERRSERSQPGSAVPSSVPAVVVRGIGVSSPRVQRGRESVQGSRQGGQRAASRRGASARHLAERADEAASQ